jgi:hypothetical protein
METAAALIRDVNSPRLKNPLRSLSPGVMGSDLKHLISKILFRTSEISCRAFRAGMNRTGSVGMAGLVEIDFKKTGCTGYVGFESVSAVRF